MAKIRLTKGKATINRRNINTLLQNVLTYINFILLAALLLREFNVI